MSRRLGSALLTRRAGALVASLAASLAALTVAPLVTPLAAQTPPGGVRIGLTYQAGAKPGVFVLPIRAAAGDSIRAILQRDLDFGDRVTVIPGDGPASAGASVAGRPATLNYRLYAALGAAALVEVVPSPRGWRVTLHDVTRQQAIDTREVMLPAPAFGEAWRQALHRASDAVEEALTGTRGIAASRLLFVRGRRVWRVDSDGANAQPVSDVGALSPAWHPGGTRFAFSQFGDNGTRIMVQELGGAARAVPGAGRGLNITPAFSPDGRTLVWASGEGNGTDLVAREEGETAARPVTVGRGADNVSPTFSPDGRRLAFTSGRSGHPEVYIADADGTNAELLTPFAFGDRAYRSNPSWSPDGRAVAYQSQLEGRFQVMTIALRDRTSKQLTSDGENEDPSWAPDGRHVVVVSTRGGRRDLWVLDAESGRTRQLTTGGDARMPAWGPRP